MTVNSGDDSATLAAGCYQYTLTGTDNVGNTATATSAVVMVDTTPPALAITTTGAGNFSPAQAPRCTSQAAARPLHHHRQ